MDFTAEALVKRLVALVPPSHKHVTTFHGVDAPNARLRPVVMRSAPGALPPSPPAPQLKLPGCLGDAPGQAPKSPRLDWATLQARTFGAGPDWNGTTSGVRVPDGGFIAANRAGLTLCDATSAVFAMELPWEKLDVVTFSWQKVLGGEGSHGMLVLSPRAVERLTTYKPAWPLPKVFRLTNGGALLEEIFEGSTINTPSMLANEDFLDALAWAKSLGGLPALIARCQANLAAFEAFVASHPWIHFLAADKASRSNTSVCLTLDLTPDQVKKIVKLLEAEKVAFDCGAYKDAPPGLRFWCGATVETADVERVLPWLEWAYEEVRRG